MDIRIIIQLIQYRFKGYDSKNKIYGFENEEEIISSREFESNDLAGSWKVIAFLK